MTLPIAAAVSLVSWLGYVLWARRRLRRTPDVFACRLRVTGPCEVARWPRTRRYGQWTHEALLIHRGPSLARSEALVVTSIAGPVFGDRVRRMGRRPVWLRLQVDDGRLFDLVTPGADLAHALGPFDGASLRARRGSSPSDDDRPIPAPDPDAEGAAGNRQLEEPWD